MTRSERSRILAAARQLIFLLNECDDGEFVEQVLECIAEADAVQLGYCKGLRNYGRNIR